jgi:hypothetical protein
MWSIWSSLAAAVVVGGSALAAAVQVVFVAMWAARY